VGHFQSDSNNERRANSVLVSRQNRVRDLGFVRLALVATVAWIVALIWIAWLVCSGQML
jgi:hypothetical protein